MNERSFAYKNRRERYEVRDDVAPRRGFEPPQRLRALRAADVPTRSPLRGNRSGMTQVGGSNRISERRKKERRQEAAFFFWHPGGDSNLRPTA